MGSLVASTAALLTSQGRPIVEARGEQVRGRAGRWKRRQRALEA
jgi:hypothetical protein